METLISASLLGCDLSRAAEEIDRAQRAGSDWLHYDVMDGLFVPSISFGEPLLKSIKKHCAVPVDVHLMITDPVRYIGDFAEDGADLITFHIEAADDPGAVLDRIHSLGLKAGISVKPFTPVSVLEPYLDRAELFLVMTVEPGFGGQSFMMDTLGKISELRGMLDSRGISAHIQVDGGINGTTAQLCREAGADVLVSGSYIFGARDMKKAVSSLRQPE